MESSVAVASYPTPPHTNRKSLFPWARLVPPPPLPPAVRVPSTSHTRGNGKLMTRNYSVRAEGMGAPSIRNTDLAGASRGGAKVKGRKSNSRGCGASAVAQDRPVSRICRFPTLWFRGVHAIRRSSGAGRVLASLVTRARGPGVLANGSYASGFRRVTARVRGPQVPIARFCDGFGGGGTGVVGGMRLVLWCGFRIHGAHALCLSVGSPVESSTTPRRDSCADRDHETTAGPHVGRRNQQRLVTGCRSESFHMRLQCESQKDCPRTIDQLTGRWSVGSRSALADLISHVHTRTTTPPYDYVVVQHCIRGLWTSSGGGSHFPVDQMPRGSTRY